MAGAVGGSMIVNVKSLIASLAALAVLGLAGSTSAKDCPHKAATKQQASARNAPFVMASPLAGSFDWTAPFAVMERFSSHVRSSTPAHLNGALPAKAAHAPNQFVAFAQAAGMKTYAYLASLTGKPAAEPAKAKTSA